MTLPDFTEQLRQLVATPSVSATDPRLDMGNRAVVELLAGWLEDMGFAVELQPLPYHPDKLNLIATMGSGPGGLVLAGHTDTVPYDDGRWHTDPFRLEERDNRFYGLGTTDMKGFFPLALAAAASVKPEQLKQPLIILATADEESAMGGARALVAAGMPRARYAVIGEPTGMHPVHMHKGCMMESIRVTGHSGHSSNPALGANALDAMHSVIGELMAIRKGWESRYQHPGFLVPVPTLNLGCIHGGDNPNRICASTELQFDIRPVPGMELEAVREEIRSRVLALPQAERIQVEYKPLFDGVPPFAEGEQSELVQATEKLTGHAAHSVAFATEAPYLQQLGMQTVVLGPGDIDQAHQPDEFLPQDRIAPMIEVLQGLVRRFCL